MGGINAQVWSRGRYISAPMVHFCGLVSSQHKTTRSEARGVAALITPN